MSKSLTIGRLAKAAEINLETIRYYQRIGLLKEPVKPPQGYRTYPLEYIGRIRFIKRAQQLGFKLQEIAELLQMGDDQAGNQCDDVRRRAEQKRQQINHQIKDLQSLRDTLDTLIDNCHRDDNSAHCPIIETLTS